MTLIIQVEAPGHDCESSEASVQFGRRCLGIRFTIVIMITGGSVVRSRRYSVDDLATS